MLKPVYSFLIILTVLVILFDISWHPNTFWARLRGTHFEIVARIETYQCWIGYYTEHSVYPTAVIYVYDKGLGYQRYKERYGY